VDSGGRVVNATKHTYGHAFAIFALAHAFRITKHEQYRDAAIATWQVVRAKLRDVGGGFRAEAPREFSGIGGLRTQNPVMHMFEALLALYKATGSHEALEGARSTGDFVINKLLRGTIDGGAYIPEWYDSNWQPLPTRQAGGYVELGHQFEWAYLLDAAAYQGLPATYAAVADRVLTYAIKTGYDDTSGGAFSVAYPEGSEVVREKGWWQQSECLRALMRFGVLYGKRDMQRRYQQTLDFVREEFVDNTNGGWRIKPKSVCSRSQCTDEQPGAYHMTAMHMEALMLSSSKAQATP
jgi:mannose-6-phosphate isomerase